MAECSNLTKFTPEQLSYTATTIAAAMAKDFDDDSVAVLSSFFFGIGSTLGLIARQRTLLKDCCAAKNAEDRCSPSSESSH